jgi:hypothetical protein
MMISWIDDITRGMPYSFQMNTLRLQFYEWLLHKTLRLISYTETSVQRLKVFSAWGFIHLPQQ